LTIEFPSNRPSSRFEPKKSLGQHFLSDHNILSSIAKSVAVGVGDTVIEVGPGLGSLTQVLAHLARRVIAIEIDADLVKILRNNMPSNVEIIHGDAREIDIPRLVDGIDRYKLLGNLPYYAAVPILRRFLESDYPPVIAAVLVQREVANQICATPGSMSLMSLAIQLYGKPHIERLIRPGSFRPPPAVTSALVTIVADRRPDQLGINIEKFFLLARAGFSAPRKQLRNSLAGGLSVSVAEIDQLLSIANIDIRRRAETLALDEWIHLYHGWYEFLASK
jgi:16S rRNA (adenine1518-N6/adenine1519-N6)-dimethyltransferase